MSNKMDTIPLILLLLGTVWGITGLILSILSPNNTVIPSFCFGLTNMLYGIAAAFYQPSINVNMDNTNFTIDSQDDIIEKIRKKEF